MNIFRFTFGIITVITMILVSIMTFIVIADKFGPVTWWLVGVVFVSSAIYGSITSYQETREFSERFAKLSKTPEEELKEQGLSDQSIESVKKGLKQSAKGETHDLGSFTQYTEEKDD